MNKSTTPVANEIWNLIKETNQQMKTMSAELSASQKETDKQIKTLSAETDKQIKTLSAETDKQMKTLSVSQKETDKQIKTLSAETDKQIKTLSTELSASQKETDKQIKETHKGFTKARRLFETQWGKLIESLVEGKLLELLTARGIQVRQTSQRVEVCFTKKDGAIQKREFDILAVNGSEVVAVEVKTTLTPDKVKYFLENLRDFKNYFPDYKSKRIYGAVAYLRSEGKAHLFSEREGLFVIRATGDSASIINQKDFKPKAFS